MNTIIVLFESKPMSVVSCKNETINSKAIGWVEMALNTLHYCKNYM